MENAERQSFLVRNEFLIRRLHSLSGLIPVGAYMVVHLTTNASVLNGPGTFQKNVYTIHSLGVVLPLVEWVFIFLPILFHAIIGVVIVQGGLPNSSAYPTSANIRYTLQRVTGMIAFFFIMWHVFHMHGWFHWQPWLERIEPLLGAQFKPYNATSTAAAALSGRFIVQVLYAIGVLASVFHLANGIWTMGITWGVWISPAAQRRATVACAGFGVVLAVVGMSALWGFSSMDESEIQSARELEDSMLEARVEAGLLLPEARESHKRSHADEAPSSAESSPASDASPAAATAEGDPSEASSTNS